MDFPGSIGCRQRDGIGEISGVTELYFKGKEFVYNHHLAVPHRPLVPDAGRGIGAPDLSGNLIIQGYNLHALKSLLPTYAGRIDCIFIDPPYNTGNENWRYNDNVNAPMIRDWLSENPVGVEDGLRHDKWCAMMWPRLKLLHELLADTGSFWMTLDDNEAHRGKLLLDEIFLGENFVANVIWQKKHTRSNDAKYFSDNHDHIFCYAKSKVAWKRNLLPRDAEQDEEWKNEDDDPRGPWASGPCHVKTPNPQDIYEIVTPSGRVVTPPAGTSWRFSKAKFLGLVDENRIFFGKGGNNVPRYKRFLSEVQPGIVPVTIWPHGEVGHNQDAKSQITNLGLLGKFDTPKPVGLVEQIIGIATNSSSTVLDSFAGSGTTAHAVLKANAEDGGDRKFILVEMEDDIADPVTAERVRRVINGYDHAGKATAGLGGGFTFCTLGDAIDLDRILTGDDLPAWDALAPVLYHMATNRTLDPATSDAERHFVGVAGDEHVWMIYRPDLDWLKSDAAALTLSGAKEIQDSAPDKRHLVFAPARYVSETVLREHGLNIAYVPFPNALYRVTREG